MPDTASEIRGFGPVEEIIDTAITDRNELDALEKRLRQAGSTRDLGNHAPVLDPTNGLPEPQQKEPQSAGTGVEEEDGGLDDEKK